MADNSSNTSNDQRSLGRSNLPVVSAWSHEERILFWREHKGKRTILLNDQEPIPFSECHIWTGSVNNGYPVVSMGHGVSKPKMHHLAVYYATGSLPTSKQVVAHLCNRKLCINPLHLAVVTTGNNSARIGCPLYFQAPNSQDVWITCPHTPRCLRRDTDNLTDYEPYKYGDDSMSESDE